jgi:hypothetical protein
MVAAAGFGTVHNKWRDAYLVVHACDICVPVVNLLFAHPSSSSIKAASVSCLVEGASASPEVTATGVGGNGPAISTSSLSARASVGGQGYTIMQVPARQITQGTASDETEQYAGGAASQRIREKRQKSDR